MGVSREAQWKRAKIKGACNILAQQFVKSMGWASCSPSAVARSTGSEPARSLYTKKRMRTGYLSWVLQGQPPGWSVDSRPTLPGNCASQSAEGCQD